MSIEPVKIPQNVYIEDRIVGPLTLRQVLISAIGCGFSYAMFSLVSKTYGGLTLPITIILWIPGALSIVFAFVKFNDLTMFQMVLLTLERMSKAPVRTWAPRKGISITLRTVVPSQVETPHAIPTVVDLKNRSRFAELSAILDQDEVEEMQPVTAAAETNDETHPAEEPVPTNQPESSMLRPLPVNKTRISVTPLQPLVPEAHQDDEPRGRISLFHDIHPAS